MAHRGIRTQRRTLAALIALALASQAAAQSGERLLPATLDRRDAGVTVRVLNDPDTGYWIHLDDVRLLGLMSRPVRYRRYADEPYIAASAIAALVRIDEVAERIDFTTPRPVVPATRPPTPAYLSPPPWPPNTRPATQRTEVLPGPMPATRPPTPAYLSPPPSRPRTRAHADSGAIPLSPPPATRPPTTDHLSSPPRQMEPARHDVSAAMAPSSQVTSPATLSFLQAPASAQRPTLNTPVPVLPAQGPFPPDLLPAARRPVSNAVSTAAPIGEPARSPAPTPNPIPRDPGTTPLIPAPVRVMPQPATSRPIEALASSAPPPVLAANPVEAPRLKFPTDASAAPAPIGVETPANIPVPVAQAVKIAADPQAGPEAAPTAAVPPPREERFSAIRNHVDTGFGVALMTDSEGRQWIRAHDLRSLDIPSPTGQHKLYADETYVPLGQLTVRTDIDSASRRLHILDDNPPAPIEGTLIVDIVVNRLALPEAHILEWRDGEPWLPPEAMTAAGLIAPADTADAAGWAPVSALAGNHYVLDTVNLLLDLTAPPERFATLHIDGRNQARRSIDAPPVTAGSPAFLLGYDLAAGRNSGDGSWTSALVDAGVSFGRTSCSSRHVWRSDQHFVRLDSVCTTDWPERRLSLVLGDAASRDWGQSGAVSYGGIRLGTDFGLQPYLLTQPLLGLTGTARLPSVLEVWTEQQLALRTEIGPGQFVIDGLPTLSGRGEISTIVIDPLGRRTRITSPFYSDPSLLADGLTDWAIEGGQLRTGLGTSNDNYGNAFFQAGLRRGMTNWWTTAMHIAGADDLRVIGWSNHFRLGLLGIAELAATDNASNDAEGRGWTLGYSYRAQRWGFGFRHTRRDEGYADLAWPEPGTAPRREFQVGMNLHLGRGSASVGGLHREDADGSERSFAQLAIGTPLMGGHLSLGALRSLEPDDQTSWSATWTMPLSWGNIAIWTEGDRRSVRPGVALQRNQPVGPGYGYRLSAQDVGEGNWRTSADLRWRTNPIEGGVTAYRDDKGSSMNAHVGGALVLAGGDLHAAGAREGSYAIVRLPASGVRVYRDHQVVGTTGSDGTAIVTRLRPFEANRLSVAADDLPMETQIGLAGLDVVPGRRQVVRADFETSALRSLALRVRGPDGKPPAAGSLVRLLPGEALTQTGHDGLLYLEYSTPPANIVIESEGGAQCTIIGASLPHQQALGDIAEISCQGGAP